MKIIATFFEKFYNKNMKKATIKKICMYTYILALGFLIFLSVSPNGYFVMASSGESMSPTLGTEEFGLAKRLTLSTVDSLDYGDIVIFYDPDNDMMLIKRIIGLPGDAVYVDSGVAVRNGEYLDEDYILVNENIEYVTSEVTCGDNEYYVLGDNRAVSRDSRSFGCILAENIKGKLVFSFTLSD